VFTYLQRRDGVRYIPVNRQFIFYSSLFKTTWRHCQTAI